MGLRMFLRFFWVGVGFLCSCWLTVCMTKNENLTLTETDSMRGVACELKLARRVLANYCMEDDGTVTVSPSVQILEAKIVRLEAELAEAAEVAALEVVWSDDSERIVWMHLA